MTFAFEYRSYNLFTKTPARYKLIYKNFFLLRKCSAALYVSFVLGILSLYKIQTDPARQLLSKVLVLELLYTIKKIENFMVLHLCGLGLLHLKNKTKNIKIFICLNDKTQYIPC